MKIIIAPDKFKGSLTSFEVCEAIAEGIRQVDETAGVFLFPMADGGDGFAEVMKYYLQTDTIDCTTVDPLGRDMQASYQWNLKNKTAIIEMAVASGLILLKQDERDPLKTSTYGTGLLIKDAVDKGAEKIILGLGGSATNDAGIGILSALGFHFKDKNDQSLKACGENLLRIEKIISPPAIPNIKFEIACDVQNILYGPQGAAYVYGPQKGADTNAVKLLDEGLKHFANILKQQTGRDISAIPGTGAAGGIAAGLMGFFDVDLKKGISIIIRASGIENKMAETDLFITGEGKIDEQTLAGKVVSEISQLANQYKIPVAAFCGTLEADSSIISQLHLEFVESLTSSSITREEAMANAKQLLTKRANQLFKKLFL
ncbi:MAG TPA: glycerate kinase [Chitinophagaceae bacterium]|jgi:glycerate kinase|nr:glycerate kinase [Chitinophagaceae bacterium]